MTFETQGLQIKNATPEGQSWDSNELLDAVVAQRNAKMAATQPADASRHSNTSWLENPLAVSAGAGIGVGLAREVVPLGFDTLASHSFARGGRWGKSAGTLGSELFGEGSRLAGRFPGLNLGAPERAINEVSRAGLHPLANAWKENALLRSTASAATTTVGTVESTAAAGTEAVSGLRGLRNTASGLLGTAGRYVGGEQGLRQAGGAALLVGGAAIADRALDENGYHLAVPGVALGLMARQGLAGPAVIGLGALAVSKALGPADPDIERIMRPGFSDTALLVGAASLPLAGEAKAITVGGAFVLGRMAHMNNSEAALASSAVGLAAYAKTHNPYVAVAAGTGSWLSSRALGWMA